MQPNSLKFSANPAKRFLPSWKLWHVLVFRGEAALAAAVDTDEVGHLDVVTCLVLVAGLEVAGAGAGDEALEADEASAVEEEIDLELFTDSCHTL